MSKQLLILSEGSHGHLSQSQGLAETLAKRVDLEITTVETRPKLGGLSRWWLRKTMGKHGKPVSQRMLTHTLRCTPPQDHAAPDLIICSGGKSVFAARTLAARYEIPLIFIGERKPYPASWFHTVFTPSQQETAINDLPIELIPTKITRETAQNAAEAWAERPQGKLWAMLIGGSSSSHRYTPEDWQALANGLNVWSTRYGIRWLLTTSPRTGKETEDLLREIIEPGKLAKAIWWAEKPEKKLAAMLGAAEGICTTQDSVTMVTEAVAVGKPVISLRPALTTFAETSFLPGYFGQLENKGRMIRAELSQFAELDLATLTFEPRTEAIQDELAEIVIQRLNLV
jgi:uncharacterized protein